MLRPGRIFLGAIALVLVLPGLAMASVTTSGKPTITGTAKVGDTLTCNGPTWTSDDGGTPEPVDYTWYYASDESTPISESFDGSVKTYAVQAQDVGQQIVCTQTEEDQGSGDFTDTTSGFSAPTSAVAGGTPPTSTRLPSITGTPQVGNDLFCDPGTWRLANPNDGQNDEFNWYYSTDLNTPIANGSNTEDYTPTSADVGKRLVCTDTATDETTGGSATADSAAVTVVPTASVTITQYSPSLSGNIGESVTGVSVTVSLQRRTQTGSLQQVASGTASTASGAWSVTLTPAAAGVTDAFGAPNDVLQITYAQGTAPSGTALPDNTSYSAGDLSFEGAQSTIASTGHTITSDLDASQCADLTYSIDGAAAQATSPGGPDGTCELTGQTLTNQNHVQARFLQQVFDASEIASNVTTRDDVGLLGVSGGAPTCSGDLVFKVVTCANLGSGSYAVSVNGGAAVPLTSSANGDGTFTGTATVSNLASGTTLTLDETAPAATTRHLTTLHVATLVVNIAADGSESGTCTPNKAFADTEALCSAAGTFSGIFGGSVLFDDLSGGSTVVDMPTLVNLVPNYNESMVGNWTSYGDLSAPASTAATLAATSSVNLQITPHGGGAAVFNKNMTPGSDALGPFETVTTSNLAAGRYFATWQLTDSHGDKASYQNLFVQQPGGGNGAQGPQGPAGGQGSQGPAGPQGPQGPAGRSSKCTVTTTGKGKHKKQHIKCSFISPARDLVSVDIARGKKTYAVGTAVVHAGLVHFKLRTTRAIRRGTYVLTIVETHAGKATVNRYRIRI